MFSLQKRHLAGALASAFVLCSGSAWSQAVDCSLDADFPYDTKILDSLDDLVVGPVTSPSVRTCADSSPTPTASYALHASTGGLRAVETYKNKPGRSVITTVADGVLRIDGFPEKINGAGVTLYGTDADGKYLPRARLVVTVYGADGSVLQSSTIPAHTRQYVVGGVWNVALGAVEVKALPDQPFVDVPVYPAVANVVLWHDYSMLP